MGKSSKHKSKKKKDSKKKKKSRKEEGKLVVAEEVVPEAFPVTAVPEETAPAVVRDEWMTKAKEGWLSAPRAPPREGDESGEHKKESTPLKPGLFFPKGTAERQDGRSSTVVGDGGASWRLKALKRMKERSHMEEKSLEQIAAERGVNLEQLKRDAARPMHRTSDRRPRHSSHRSYLDDVHSHQSQMQKPRTEKSSFARRREGTPEKRRSSSSTQAPVSLNAFPNDGSFFEMFSKQNSLEVEAHEERGAEKEDRPNAGNASIAEQLRQHMKSGVSMEDSRSSTKSAKAMPSKIGPVGISSAGLFGSKDNIKKRRDVEETEDIATLYKRSRRGDDALDMDKALAKNITQRRRFNAKEDLNVDQEYDFGVGTDLFEKKKKKNRNLTLSDLQHRERRHRLKAEQQQQSLQDRCVHCFDGSHIPKHLVVSIATTSYLRLPQKGALNAFHCYIVPLEHVPSTREVEEDVWTEIRNFKKALIQMNKAQERDVVFLETALHLRDHRRHAFVECIPVEPRVLERAPIYFKKAIDDATADWSQHHAKRCIETGSKGLRGSIPEHFPYFHVEFNLSHGFVHVIDDEADFDPDLGRRVLIGLLNRPAEEMYKSSREGTIEEQRQGVNHFLKEWHPFDWTLQL